MALELVLQLEPFAWSGDAPGTGEGSFPVVPSHLPFSHWKR